MSSPESGQIVDAPPPAGFTTPTKPIRNDGAGHVNPDAERMETESDADVEKEFEKSTGKKRRNAGPLVLDSPDAHADAQIQMRMQRLRGSLAQHRPRVAWR